MGWLDEEFPEAFNPDWPDRIIHVNGNASILGVVVFLGEPLQEREGIPMVQFWMDGQIALLNNKLHARK